MDLLHNVLFICIVLYKNVMISILFPQTNINIIILRPVYTQLSKFGFCNIDALEPNPAMLEVAKQKGLYQRTIQAYLGTDRLDIQNSKFNTRSCAYRVHPRKNYGDLQITSF